VKYILCLLILLLAAVLLWPIKLHFSAADGKISAKLNVYFLSFDLFGPKKDKKNTTKSKKTEKKPANEAAKPEKKDSAITLDTVLALVKSLFSGLEFLSRKLHFDKVSVALTVGKDEPDETAVFFGQVNGALYTALGVLGTYFKIDYDQLSVKPDFENRCFLYKISFSFWALPVTILVTAVVVGLRFVALNPIFFTKTKK